jgi:RNA recognition motif-containing protein
MSEAELPSQTVFVCNIPYEITEASVRRFAPFPEHVHRVGFPMDHMRRPRGFCFLEYDNADLAQQAVDLLNSMKVGNRNLVCRLSKEYPPGQRPQARQMPRDRRPLRSPSPPYDYPPPPRFPPRPPASYGRSPYDRDPYDRPPYPDERNPRLPDFDYPRPRFGGLDRIPTDELERLALAFRGREPDFRSREPPGFENDRRQPRIFFEDDD